MKPAQLLNEELQKAVKKMRLSKSQEQVLSQVVQGLDNKTIAKNMDLSIAGVKSIVSYLLKRYNVENRVCLVLKVAELALYRPTTSYVPAMTVNQAAQPTAGLPVGDMNVFS